MSVPAAGHGGRRGVGARSGDVLAARRLLPSLVGRDPAAIDDAAIARAAVESVAENTTDAIVAPALWTAAAGPVGAFVYRAGDTLDSMVGYRDERYRRFGLASARLDDALAWVPARTTATLVALARPGRAPAVARAVRREARRHPSPNAGVSEAAFAGGLGLRLGGANRYDGVVEDRPILGPGRRPGPRDITWLLAGLLVLAGTGGAIVGRRRGAVAPGSRSERLEAALAGVRRRRRS